MRQTQGKANNTCQLSLPLVGRRRVAVDVQVRDVQIARQNKRLAVVEIIIVYLKRMLV